MNNTENNINGVTPQFNNNLNNVNVGGPQFNDNQNNINGVTPQFNNNLNNVNVGGPQFNDNQNNVNVGGPQFNDNQNNVNGVTPQFNNNLNNVNVGGPQFNDNQNNMNVGVSQLNNNQNNVNNEVLQFNNNPNNNDTNKIMSLLKNKKVLIIGLVIIIVFILIFVLGRNGLGGHKNTTGLSDYNASDVNYNCISDISEGNKLNIVYSDVLFNHDGYQAVLYNKLEIGYKDNTLVTDEKYKEYIGEITLSYFPSEIDFSKDYLDLELTKLGSHTKVTRKRDKLIITYSNLFGLGYKATKSDIKVFMQSLEKEGYECK